MAKQPALASSPSTNAAVLLDKLLVAISQPVANDLGGAVATAEAAFERRTINAVIRSKDEVQTDLDRARRQAIKTDLDGDDEGHKAAAEQVAIFERELADLDVKREALAELADERRNAVDAANTALGDRLSAYRDEVGETAKALEAEALRLWSVAATARKAVQTTDSRFDQFGMLKKTPEMELAISEAKDLIPQAWASAISRWWRIHEWQCRP
jgi:hypothetical protein